MYAKYYAVWKTYNIKLGKQLMTKELHKLWDICTRIVLLVLICNYPCSRDCNKYMCDHEDHKKFHQITYCLQSNWRAWIASPSKKIYEHLQCPIVIIMISIAVVYPQEFSFAISICDYHCNDARRQLQAIVKYFLWVDKPYYHAKHCLTCINYNLHVTC